MGSKLPTQLDPVQPMIFQIRIKGHLGSQWTDWFEGLTITLEENGETLLRGPVADQAALHGLLKKIRDLGTPLVSVVQVRSNDVDPHESKKEKEMKVLHRSISETPEKISTLWILVMFYIAYADIIGFLEPGTLARIVNGETGFELTPAIIVILSLLQAIPICMIFVSRWLRREVSRWSNIAASVLTLLYVIGGGNWQSASYVVFASLEIVAMLGIIWLAWNWHNVQA